jgi:uncharacterized membrane protein YbhN (UPF0104 family)
LNKRSFANAFAIFLTIVAIAGAIHYLKSNDEIWKLLKNLTAIQVVLLIIVRIIFIGLNGVLLYIIALKFNVKLRMQEWFGLAYTTSLFNYVTPFSGGMLIRATYLKLKHEIPYSQFAAWLAATYFVIFFVTGGISAFLALRLTTAVPNAWVLVVGFLIMMLTIVLILNIPSIRLPSTNKVFKMVNAALIGWESIKSDKLLLAKLTLFTILLFLVNGISFWLAYRSLGISISFSAALIVSLANIYSAVISLTPGNIGPQEVMVSILSGMTGAGIEESLLTILLVRTTTLVSVFTLGPLFSLLLARNLRGNQLLNEQELG